jgi:hypothetical protein
MKKEHFEGADFEGFLYMLKPTEAKDDRPREDLVIMTSFTTAEITKMNKLSAEMWDLKGNTVALMLSTLPLCPPEAFLMTATRAVLHSLRAEKKQFHNGIRHQILTAMFERSDSLQKFVIQKYAGI